MNLYRNFGNLMENLLAESYSDLHFQSGAGLDRSDSFSRESVPVFNVKSESEDSGVETVSSTSPCHSYQCSGLATDESQLGFGSGTDGLQPPSPSPSICSSSSSSSCVSLGSVAYMRVEQALRRTEPSLRRGPPHQIERGLGEQRYRCNTASFHTNSSRANHRFARPRRTRSQPPDSQKAELYRGSLKTRKHGNPFMIEQADGGQTRLLQLSPGLVFLEQICRMLENIAQLQQQNHELQSKLDTLRSQQAETQHPSFQEEEVSHVACQRCQVLGHGELESGLTLDEPMVFRQRSLSDTQTTSFRHRKARFVQDEQITPVLVEESEDFVSKQEEDSIITFNQRRNQSCEAFSGEGRPPVSNI
ncbi:hypothetical protein DNTS_015440 [Danionella cerebrum]|uniref:DUF4657 domain-containing protein n=1 Tax=Danionella cerebrum TaxID=2873325 RepID=A0A553NIM6_9TELE|nr:hypothetical protein DNTS_015440 [Danionella translucida]